MTPDEKQFAAEPVRFLRAQGYSSIRRLPTGEWAGIKTSTYYYSVMVGITAGGFLSSYDFESHEDAVTALRDWDGRLPFPVKKATTAPAPVPGEAKPFDMTSGQLSIAMSAWPLIEKLRSDEADSVTILCDNPEGDPNNAIICNGFWTNFVDRRFAGPSLLLCLKVAVEEKAKYDPATAPALKAPSPVTTFKDREIKTAYAYPPIPPRVFDWCAWFDDDGEEAGRYGWGETEAEAVGALIEHHGERDV